MKNVFKITLFILSFLISDWISAKGDKSNRTNNYINAACVRPTASYDMKVNNVRARLLTGGDLFSEAQYVTPAPNEGEVAVSGIYAAGVWMGGVDRSKNIKLSAAMYRFVGTDYFSGPLDLNGTTESEICSRWDKIFSVNGKNISQHIINFKKAEIENTSLSCEDIPKDVLFWPAHGNPYFEDEFGWALPSQPLADYWDMNNDGIYDPCDGDYPMIDDKDLCFPYHQGQLIPGEINYFIFNDNGGPQTLSGPTSMQMEFQVNAYAYGTNDELNDMTFYHYKLINKANEDLMDCYFAWWIDPDLGCYQDDFIGCDPELGIAYIYNEDVVDGNNGSSCEGTSTYGEEIPMIGFDFIRGPMVSKVYKRNTQGNIEYDTNGNAILLDPAPFSGNQDTLVEGKMSSFGYMENGGISSFPVPTIDPQPGKEEGFYNFLKGLWGSGTPMTIGGSGYNQGSTDTTKYAFPDAPNDVNGWSMCTTDMPFGDRRMIMSVGPMLLQPGATRNLTMSIFTAFDVQYPCPDITKLKFVNTIAQNLFDYCFIDGVIATPDAPDIKGIQKDKEITLLLDNPNYSNNYNEAFESQILGVPDTFNNYYRFEGYKIYQVANLNVRPNQLGDENLAKLISQSDIKNNISDIYNWRYVQNSDTTLGAPNYIWEKELRVVGNNQGLETMFDFTEDRFATDDKTLINGKAYYFMVVAYAHNNWRDFDNIEKYGQKTPYIESINAVKVYQFTPKQKFENDSQQLKVTRISGEGNPHTFLLMDDDMHEKILSPNFDGKIKYKSGYGPLHGKVLDQSKLQKGTVYRLEITGNFQSSGNGNNCQYDQDAAWKLTDITNNTVLLEDKPLWYIKEYVVNELGFSITVHQHAEPGTQIYENNGGVGALLEYKDNSGPKWYQAITLDGKYNGQKNKMVDFVRTTTHDPNRQLSQLGDGYFVPFVSTSFQDRPDFPFYLSPAAREVMGYLSGPATNSLRFRDLNNVDIVFTKDKSKWSKCIVVETASEDYYDSGTIGDAKNFELRQSNSKDENGNIIPSSVGMSYFPGYAVDVETGKRLNIFFGENSFYSQANVDLLEGKNPIGGDMIFNPSAQEFGLFNGAQFPVFGGQHFIYITRMEYDGCSEFADRLKRTLSVAGPSLINKAKVASAITWTSFPLLSQSTPMSSIADGLIPNDVVIRLRVDNPYSETRKYTTARERACDTEGDHPVYEFGFEDYINVSTKDITMDRIFVSPNPTLSQNGLQSLQLFNLPDHADIIMYDIKGQMQWKSNTSFGESQILLGPGSRKTIFDIGTEFKAGIYFIQVRDNQTGNVKTLKWIVI
jgi:hypothetical protein